MKNKIKKMFYKKVNKNSNKEMFEFLKNHDVYYTLNSWNRLYSIANNVKVYNLFEIEAAYDILEMLEVDDYFTINLNIEYWEAENAEYKVGFNGRSGGYLVLYNKNNNGNVLDWYISDHDNYEDFKESVREDYGSLKNYRTELIRQVELVQSFDKLCDNLADLCMDMLENAEIIEETIAVPKTIKRIEYN
ncbi:MAG TPA: hypothetical protein GX708_01665 [Gallicola sp.]|nr:hypothetical protein [Gallicola sp.]